MPTMTCKKCGSNMKVVYLDSKHAYVACPTCNPEAFKNRN